MGSSTMRNMTEMGCSMKDSSSGGERQPTRHAVLDVSIWRSTCRELDDGACQGPDIGGRRGTLELDNFRGHLTCWSESCDQGKNHERTPIGRPRNIVLDPHHGTKVQRDTKVGQLHIARLGRQNIRGLEIAMYHLEDVNETRSGRREKRHTCDVWR